MRTVFALFDSYADARNAIDTLLKQGFDEEEMNVLVQEAVAKAGMEGVDLHKVHMQKTDKIGEKRLRGLDAMVGGQRPVRLPDLEMVYAAGEIATIMASTAAASGASEGGFDQVLVEFGLAPQQARAYRDGIKGGGMLVWVRVEDEQAPAVSEALSRHTRANLVSST